MQRVRSRRGTPRSPSTSAEPLQTAGGILCACISPLKSNPATSLTETRSRGCRGQVSPGAGKRSPAAHPGGLHCTGQAPPCPSCPFSSRRRGAARLGEPDVRLRRVWCHGLMLYHSPRVPPDSPSLQPAPTVSAVQGGGRGAEHFYGELKLGRIRSRADGPAGGFGAADEQGDGGGICRQPQTCLMKYCSEKKEIITEGNNINNKN